MAILRHFTPSIYFVLLTCIFGNFSGSTSTEQLRYDNYKLYRVIPTNTQQVDYLRHLQSYYNQETNHGNHKVDIWTNDIALGKPVSVMVSPELANFLLAEFLDQQLELSLIWDDIQKVVDEQVDAFDKRINPFNRTMTWNIYHRYPTIEFFMLNLAQKFRELVKLEQIGESYEGRSIWMIKLGRARIDGAVKPGIWMDSGIHAREWISHATVTFMVNELLEKYEKDPESRWYLDEIDWYVVPVINPDGFEYTHLVDRLWRRTRKLDPFTECIGVDTNRNYDFMWQREKPEMDGCNNFYGGPTSFSEPENVALSDKLLELKDTLKAFLTFHSYSQAWLTPWGYKTELPEDYDTTYSLAMDATTKLTNLFGTVYQVGTSPAILYTSSGTSSDYAKGRTPIKYVYTVELRDTGFYEFLLPLDQIIPTAQETFEGVKVVASRIRDEFINNP